MPNETSTTEGTLRAMKAWMEVDAAAAKEKATGPSDAAACSTLAKRCQAEAVSRILQERHRQNLKWGEQNHDMPTWMCILHEETGELSEAILHHKFGGPESGNVFEEAVQVAAVACQIVEFLIRQREEIFLSNAEARRSAGDPTPTTPPNE